MAAAPLEGSPPKRRPILAGAPSVTFVAAAATLLGAIANSVAKPLATNLSGGVSAALGGRFRLWPRRREQEPVAQSPVRSVQTEPTPTPFAAILEALEDPVLVITGDEPDDLAGRRLIYANAAALELFRTSRDAAPLATVVRDPQVLETVDEALFGQIVSETVYEAGGVQDRVWRARAKPLGEHDGRRLALLTLRDETELRRSERTRADFLANASHELRTPLASLTGFIETLRGHAKDDPAARDRFLAIMQSQAGRMARLIDDLMSLSRIQLNEHIPPQGRLDLSLTLKDVTDALAPLAEEKNVRLETQLAQAPTVVQPADRDQIVQVVQNLTENALKYAPPGSAVTIDVRTEETVAAAMAPSRPGAALLSLLTPDHAGDQRYVVLRVADTGAGMSREHLPRLTERFYRVEGQRGGERSGTGLGLAIVKHIMNRHRGGLMVESALGEGSVFSAYFPTAPDAT